MTYVVHNTVTNKSKVYKCRDKAYDYADRVDAEYGRVVCIVKPVW